MMKTTFTDALIAGRKYEITQARMGDTSYQRMLDGKNLLFEPSFVYASNPANYEFQNRLGQSEPVVEGKAMLMLAQRYLTNWPQSSNSCKGFVSTWKSAPLEIPKNVASTAMQDYAKAKASIDVFLGSQRDDDYKTFRYWYGITHKDPATGKHTYYPSISEIFSYAIPNMNRVRYADGSKEGAINFLLKYDGNQANKPHDVIINVEITWDDGSITIEPYSNIVHLTPNGDVASCRVQDNLGAYRNGLFTVEEKSYNDIPEKMAVVMVIMAMMQRKYPRAAERTALTPLVDSCAKTQQPANMTEKYMDYKEIDATVTPPVVKAYGWASQGSGLGFDIVLNMWKYISNDGIDKVADWGAFPAKFLENVQDYSVGETTDTGLVVCPHCKACDYLQDANIIDFGVYFGNDDNPLESVTCEPKLDNEVYVFRAIGLIKCSHCSEPYYRLFKSQMRTFTEQIPIGENELKLRRSYGASWVLRSAGKGARQGQIYGYMFREHTQGNLPSILFYLYYAGTVMSVEYPLEAGKMSRVALKDLVCTGESRKDGIPSHTYYDNNYAPPEPDPSSRTPISMLGGGKYRGPQAIWRGVDPATGTKSCKLCDKVGVATTLGEGSAYQNGARLLLDIDRGDGSKVFDRIDEDIFYDVAQPHYKIRLTTPRKDTVRYLRIPFDKVGISVKDSPPIIKTKMDGKLCPNDIWAKKMEETVEEYAESLKNDKGLDSEFLVCEGLAWSARYDPNTRKWLVSQPRNENSWLSGYDYVGGTTGEIDATTWLDGENKKCTLGDLSQIDRFPAKECQAIVSYQSPFASCLSVQPIKTSHKVSLRATEIEEVNDVKVRRDYYGCDTCEASYKASDNMADASQFIVPSSTDPTNTPPIVKSETGLYDPRNEWHFTRWLYEPHSKDIQDLATMSDTKDSAKRKIPKNIFKWLEDGKTFPQSGTNSTQSGGNKNDE